MSRLFAVSFLSLGLLAGYPAFADHDCSCSKKCAAECAKGKSDKCSCKDCECSKGEGCKHKKCSKSKEATEQE